MSFGRAVFTMEMLTVAVFKLVGLRKSVLNWSESFNIFWQCCKLEFRSHVISGFPEQEAKA